MAPRKNPFNIVRMIMVGAGLTQPSSGLTYRLMVAFNYAMLSLAWLPICNDMLGLAYIADDNLALQLENVSFLLAGGALAVKFAFMTFRKKQLFSHLARMETLMEEMEKVFGTDAFLPEKKSADLLAIGNILLISIMNCFPSYALVYYKFYVEGDNTAIPFGIYMPFDTTKNVHRTVWYQVFLFYSVVYCVVMCNTIAITMALVTSGNIAKICDRYESLNLLKDQSSLQETIKWHSDVIKIVEETNSLFGVANMVDYLLSIVYISICGYLLVKVGLADKSRLPKYSVLYCSFMFSPSFVCYGGHLISSESDKLSSSIFANNWYQASGKERKTLILPAMMAKKRLCWKYNGFFYFDMNTYFQIVRQSYSFITMLRLMEKDT